MSRVLRRVSLSLWTMALGSVVLYVFFMALGEVAPGEVAGLTAVVAALGLLFALRQARVGSELRDRGGDPALRDEYNRARERRGF